VKVLERRERIDEIGSVVVSVVHDEPHRVRRAMLRDLEPPGPVAVDLERVAYGRYGLRRASIAGTYLSRYALRDYAERLRGRGRHMRPGRDPGQLGGDFVIDPVGRIAYSHPQAHSADRPPVSVLIRELERAAGRA
jgi:hypothetical protein